MPLVNRSDRRGLAVWSYPDGRKQELDTFTCVHCNAVKYVQPGESATDTGGWCFNCAAAICKGCVEAGKTQVGCEHFMKKIERAEARGRLLASIG